MEKPEEQPILVIGAAGLDVVSRIQGELAPGVTNPSRIRASYGGVARNVAENLVRLGESPICLLSVVGKDQVGDDVLAYTRAAGVDVSNVHRSGRAPTGSYMAVLNEKGRLKFAFDDMRILSELTDSYLAYHEDLFEIARLVFLDANLPEPALETAFALAKRFDAPVCADPTSAVLAPRLRPYLDSLRLVAPNATEAGLLLGEPFDPADREAALEAARALVNRGVEIVLITLAEFGLCYATSETNGHIPAIRTRIADPTGAGDALTAAMLYGLLNDIDIDDAARLGVAAASLALRYPGTVDPDLSLQRLYDQLPL